MGWKKIKLKHLLNSIERGAMKWCDGWNQSTALRHRNGTIYQFSSMKHTGLAIRQDRWATTFMD